MFLKSLIVVRYIFCITKIIVILHDGKIINNDNSTTFPKSNIIRKDCCSSIATPGYNNHLPFVLCRKYIIVLERNEKWEHKFF